ncbi:MAG: hypothetical protein CHACPFDD_03957 [Phycisphaerae bacterium]|nr:hypothetical protein [Phycisphaerae bacterium]
MNTLASTEPLAARRGAWRVETWLVLGTFASLLWSYWPTVRGLIREWQRNPEYSVGQLVPLAAAYVVWRRRGALAGCRVTPFWGGLGLILAGEALRAFGLLYVYDSIERFSLVVTAAGALLLALGREVFWACRWVIAFLLLMVPLPATIHNLISAPLQEASTAGAVFALEMLGATVDQDGFTLTLNDRTQVGVVEACSGLRMLTAFVVVASTLALLVERPRWKLATLVISSVPIAIVCNLVRLVATSLLYMVVEHRALTQTFHDVAGVAMMPLALLLLIVELRVLDGVAGAGANVGRARANSE